VAIGDRIKLSGEDGDLGNAAGHRGVNHRGLKEEVASWEKKLQVTSCKLQARGKKLSTCHLHLQLALVLTTSHLYSRHRA
jgi:hypothetical protein